MARRKRKPAQQSPQQFTETDPELLALQYQRTMNEITDAVVAKMQETEDWADPDESEWSTGTDVAISGLQFEQNLQKFRRMAKTPYGIRILNLYRWYVTKDVCVKLCPKDDEAAALAEDDPVVKAFEGAVEMWEEENSWFSHGEAIERKKRDGEILLWRNGDKVRFLDPENLMTSDNDHQAAIKTDELDVVSVQEYIVTRKVKDEYGVEKREVVATITPENMLHVKNAADSSTKRGTSIFDITGSKLSRLARTEDNEFMLRLSQSAITKVISTTGGTAAVSKLMNARASTTTSNYDNISTTAKVRPGTEITKGAGVDVKFSHPDNNFSDASPLIAWFLKMVAVATGWSYAQISCDSSEGNLASMAISEGPVAEMIHSEREEHEKLAPLYKWIAEIKGVDIDWGEYEVEFMYKPLATMEPLKNAQMVNLGIMNQTICRETGSELQGRDGAYEKKKIAEEVKSGIYNAGFNNQNPTQDDKQQSSTSNAQQGSGTNQGS